MPMKDRSPKKSLWVVSMMLVGVVGGVLTVSIESVFIFLLTTATTLCFGYSLGMHRRFIHHSYECPKWLEYFSVYLGVLVGLAGPMGMMYTHDIRDWAQRQKNHTHILAIRLLF
jgi:fatty-acid desaturase